MAQATDLNIVVVGGSFAGISVVHNLMKHVLPEVTASKKFSYRVVVISPSTHLYWNISAPRAVVSTKLISHEDSFQPISKAFARYPTDLFEYVKGTLVGLDTVSRTIKIVRPSEQGTTRFSTVQESSKAGQQVGSAIDSAVNTVAGLWKSEAATESPEQHKSNEEELVLPYHALILATGSTAHSPLLSLRGPHTNTLNMLDEFQKQLHTSRTVVIAGGGPSGVETAGQIRYWYNQRYGPTAEFDGLRERVASLLSFIGLTRSSSVGPHAKEVILLCSSARLLPNLHGSLGFKALRQLTRLGVRVVLDIRVESASVAASTNKTTLRLSNGSTMVCDQYVPCTGVTANTQFLPADSPLLRSGSIATVHGPSTLRVEVPQELMPPSMLQMEANSEPGDHNPRWAPDVDRKGETHARVYAIGDCAAYSAKCILDIYAAMPVLMHNLVNDLTAYQLYYENPYGGNREKLEDLQLQDMEYVKDQRDSQVVPIGYRKPGGVGIVFGVKLPSIVVWLAKGRGYKVSSAKKVIEQGLSPY